MPARQLNCEHPFLLAQSKRANDGGVVVDSSLRGSRQWGHLPFFLRSFDRPTIPDLGRPQLSHDLQHLPSLAGATLFRNSWLRLRLTKGAGIRRKAIRLRKVDRRDRVRRMVRFSDDDLSYLAWIATHPDGFVLNVRCSSDRNCVVLHRASCTSISNDTHEPGAYTGRNHRKICATSEGELKLAAQDEGRRDGTFSKRCGLCLPLTFARPLAGDPASARYDNWR
jgi:hypothetical protein